MVVEASDVEFAVDNYPWDKVWKLDVPPKVRIFLWRVLREVLPCKSSLLRRHVELDPTCPVCATAEESAFHVLYSCSFARSCWLLSSVG